MGHRLQILAGVLASALLSGCATAPPATYSVANARFYPVSSDVIFNRALAQSSRQDLLVTATDRRSGVIALERAVNAPSRSGAVYDWADCGAISLMERPVSQLAELTLVVQPAPGGSNVTVNTRFSELRQDSWRNALRVNCTSTGALERQMLTLLSR